MHPATWNAHTNTAITVRGSAAEASQACDNAARHFLGPGRVMLLLRTRVKLTTGDIRCTATYGAPE